MPSSYLSPVVTSCVYITAGRGGEEKDWRRGRGEEKVWRRRERGAEDWRRRERSGGLEEEDEEEERSG